MQHLRLRSSIGSAILAIAIALLIAMSPSWAAITDISPVPLGTSTNGTVVKPNILFILDASGSMDSEYEPDNVKANFACRASSTGSTVCDQGDAPFQADRINGMSYNPQVTYRPGVDYLGRTRGSMTNFASVPMDAYYAEEGKTNNPMDITKSWYHNGWCSTDTCTSATRWNGRDNAVNGTFAYATPPKPSITGVSFSRSNFSPFTVTGTKVGHNVAVGDVIDVVGAGTCSAQQVVVTFADSTTFKYVWGDSAVPSCSSMQGTVNFSVRGYPEQTGISLQPTTALARPSSSSVTVTYPGHGFVVGDVVDITGGAVTTLFTTNNVTKLPSFTSSNVTSKAQTVTVDWAGTTSLPNGTVVSVTGGGANCTAPSVAITVVSATRFTYPAPGNGQCSGTYTFNPTTVTINNSGVSLLSNGDVVDVVGGGTGCLATSATVTVVTQSQLTYQTTATGSCSGTYSVQKHSCNTTSAGAPVTNALAGQFTVNLNGNLACTGTYGISRRPANVSKSANMNPVYFTLSPTEYCSDPHLTDCIGATRPQIANIPGRPNGGSVNFAYPAYVRYCSSQAAAAAAPIAPSSAPATAPSGAAITCVDKYYSSYVYPRYGMFTRGEIKPTISTYGNRPNRADCANAPNCTYTEEMTNFGNWLAYYRKRIQAMKTSVGLSFSALDDRYRVGFMIITFANDTSAVTCTYDKNTLTAPPCPSGTEFVPIDAFIPAQKQAFFNAMYSQIPAHGTPLRQALTRAGRYFAGLKTGINAGLTPDPVQYSCQQNFALLTTDGMWKDYPVAGDGAQIDGVTAVGNQDNDLNDPSGTVSRAAGTFDGNCAAGDVTKSPGGCANTLADVAMYYYKTDLRSQALGNATGALGQDVSADNVPTTPTDPANWQHMTTFTLALADGLMNWQPDYASSNTGDFKNITTGASGCWWSGSSACNWPSVVADTPTALDDLWHAAVNGHGQYFHAGDAQSLTTGLTGALGGMSARTAAASASATSSPNITQQDNVIYSTTYQTSNWTGQLVAQYIDTTTGNVLPGILWQAQQALDARTGPTSDSRTIYTLDDSGKLRDFKYSSLDSAAQKWMDNVCGSVPLKLSQCAPNALSSTQLSWLNAGENLVNFIRGWSQNEGTILRDRSHALGDTVDATPVYVRAPIYNFNTLKDAGYTDFKSQQASRRPMIYLAANDGMLHAIDASVGGGGQEIWAYVPRMLIPSLYKLADINYPSRHAFFVDGSPSVMDAFIKGKWSTVLVGGLNSGGRGYYALDITDPTQPQPLWEFCSDPNLCSQSDKNLGYSYGNPVITKLPSGQWVVLLTSGYNNINPGDGYPHVFVRSLADGSKVDDLNLNAAGNTTASPMGLGRIAAWATDFIHDNTTLYAYGGDLAGNLWRFDFTQSTGKMSRMGILRDASGRVQSVTTRPELGEIRTSSTTYRAVFVGTGRYLGLSDLTDPATWTQPSTDAWQQSFYAVKDTGGDLGNVRSSLVAQTIISVNATTRTTSTNAVDWTNNNGWYVDFNPGNASPGERVNIDPLLVMGTLNVKTNVPSMNSCVFGGDSWVYQFRFDTGSYVSTAPGQVVGQKIDGATTVGFVIVGLPGGGLKDISTTATGEKRTFGVNIGVSGSGGRRVGWRELTQ